MWKHLVAVLCWVLAVHGRYYDDSSDLGEQIRAQVADQVRPLEDLGDRISAQVQQSLRLTQNNNRLSDLDTLGDRITRDLHQDLEPTWAEKLKLRMKHGVGGTAIVQPQTNGKQYVIKNHEVSSCSGSVDESTGECSGSLTPVEITTSSPPSDWCFYRHRKFSQINDQICMSMGSYSISWNNNQLICVGINNTPVLLIPVDEYTKMCSSAEYRYIPNVLDDQHVAIPNQNQYVRCENQQKNYCIFHEKIDFLNSGGTIDIESCSNNVGSVTYSKVLIVLSVVFAIRNCL